MSDKGIEIKIVGALPVRGESGIMYFVRTGNSPKNLYTEYMFVSGKWETIGSTSSQELAALKADFKKSLDLVSSKFSTVVSKRDLRSELKNYATKDSIDQKIDKALEYDNYVRLKILPTSMLPAKGESDVLYLKPKSRTEKNNYYEYIWLDRTQTFELIGSRDIDTSAFELKANAKKKYDEIKKTTTRLENWVKDAYHHEQEDIAAVRELISDINKELDKKLTQVVAEPNSIIELSEPNQYHKQTISITKAQTHPDSIDTFGPGYVSGDQLSKIYHALHSATLTFKFVDELPPITKESVTSETQYIYLKESQIKENDGGNVKNVLTEYILIIAHDEAGNPTVKGSYYEKVGEVGFDASKYYTKVDINEIIEDITNSIIEQKIVLEREIEDVKESLSADISTVAVGLEKLKAATIQNITAIPNNLIEIVPETDAEGDSDHTRQKISLKEASLLENRYTSTDKGIATGSDVQKAIDAAIGSLEIISNIESESPDILTVTNYGKTNIGLKINTVLPEDGILEGKGIVTATNIQTAIDASEKEAEQYTESLLGKGFSPTHTVETKLAEKVNTIVIANSSKDVLTAVKSGTEYTLSAAPAKINDGILSGEGYVSGTQADTAITEAVKKANTYTDNEIKKHHQFTGDAEWKFPNPEIHYFYKAAADIEGDLVLEAADTSKFDTMFIKNTIVIDNFGGAEREDFSIRLSNENDTVIYAGIIPENCMLSINTFFVNLDSGKLGINCEVWEHFES